MTNELIARHGNGYCIGDHVLAVGDVVELRIRDAFRRGRIVTDPEPPGGAWLLTTARRVVWWMALSPSSFPPCQPMPDAKEQWWGSVSVSIRGPAMLINDLLMLLAGRVLFEMVTKRE